MKVTYRQHARKLDKDDVVALPAKATDPYEIVFYTVTNAWEEDNWVYLAVEYQHGHKSARTIVEQTTVRLARDQMVTTLNPQA